MERLLACVFVVSAMFLFGCASHEKLSKDLRVSLRTGDRLKTVETINKMQEEYDDDEDGLLYCLEVAAAYRYMGDYENSNKAFEIVEQRYQAILEKAKVSASDEAAAALTNQRSRPYNGYAYDYIMMNTYKALNYLALNEPDKARVELKRVLEKQRHAVEKFAKDIEKKKAKSKKYDVAKAQRDPKYKKSYQAAFGAQAGMAPYAPYVNPFSVFLDGIYYLHAATDANDLEHSKKSLERLCEMVPGCKAVVEPDLQIIAAGIEGGEAPDKTGLTYVIFETGMGPRKDQTKIDVPLFLVSSKVSYIGAAIPKLKFQNNYLPSLSVSDGVASYSTVPICDMDRVVKTEFDAELPKVIALTMISSGVKATAAYAAERAAAEQGILWQIAAKIGGIAYQAGMNNADLRIWTLLPKQVQVARVLAKDGTVSVGAGQFREKVTVDPNKVNIIYVKSMGPNAGIQVESFNF